MKNKYIIIPTAGSRINGYSQFGSTTEQLEHFAFIREFNDIKYYKDLGFFEVTLTDEEYTTYCCNPKVLSIEKQISEVKLLSYTSLDTTTFDQWHLHLLSHKEISDYKYLCGFNFTFLTSTYGSTTIATDLVLTTTINKLIYKSVLYNYEVAYTNNILRYKSIKHLLAPNIESLPLDTLVYIGFDTVSKQIMLIRSYLSTFIPLYTVKIKHYKSIDVVSVDTMGILGFYDLTPMPITKNTFYTPTTGAGINVIIADCQLDTSNQEIIDRSQIAYNAYAARYNTIYDAPNVYNSLISNHGTALACIVAGLTTGIVSKANILGVTCLDISDRGDLSDNILGGLNWIISHVRNKKLELGVYPVVVCIAFSTSYSIALDSAIEAIIAEGALVCIGAGDSHIVSITSPYSNNALYVASCTKDLCPTVYTDYGQRIDIFAPGSSIYTGIPGTFIRMSGNSAASAVATALGMLYLCLFPSALPTEIKNGIINLAVKAITHNKPDTTSLVVQNISYSEVPRNVVITAPILANTLYLVIPYIKDFNGQILYGNRHEFTSQDITNVMISASRQESINLGTLLKIDG